MFKYFDIHSHPNFPQYDADREEMVKRLTETETGTIGVGTSLATSKGVVEMAEQYENIYACIGIHPVDDKEEFNKSKFEELLKSPRVVAVGECGMDFFHADKTLDFDRQKKLFLDQIEFALGHNLPIMIHARDAYEDILNILEPMKLTEGDKLRGNVHFFAGDLPTAERFIKIGFTLSFTGVITFTSDYDEVIKNIPLEMLMSETDAPYVAPIPYRGKRNEPSYVQEIVKRIAEIREESLDVVRKVLISNVERVFGISA